VTPCEQLAGTQTFLDYEQHLRRWIAGETTDAEALTQASAAVCSSAKDLDCRPEEILALLRRAGLKPFALDDQTAVGAVARSRDQRYTEAVSLLLGTWFATG
jgi:hypothetical protein